MNKKKILSTGAVALVAISCFGTNTFADSKNELKNSMEVNMHVDANGNTEYEYTVINGEIRTNGSTSKKLTKGRFDLIYGVMKMDSDNIVVTATTSSTLKTEQNFEQTNLLLLLEVITKQICEVNS